MHSFMTLKPFFRQHRLQYISGLCILVIVDALQLIAPKIIGRLTDEIKNRSLTYDIAWYVTTLLALAIIIAAMRYLWRMYIMGTSRKLEFYLRNKLYQHIQQLSPAFFDRQNPGDLMALATNDIKAVGMALGVGVVITVDSVFITLSSMFVMSKTIYFPLAVAAFLPLPCILLIAFYLGKGVHLRFNKVQETFAALTDNVQESIAGIRVIKGLAQEKHALDRFTGVNTYSVEQNLDLARLQSLFIPVTHALPSLCILITLLYGGKLVIEGTISLGDLVAFYGYLGLTIWPIMGFGWLINIIQRGSASMERIDRLLDEKPAIVDHSTAAGTPVRFGKVRISDLSFRYDPVRPFVLSHINLDIAPGTTLGIVGRTGSGKTTLIQLMLRLYEPPSDTIWFDGTEIHSVPLHQLRSAIGYVPQDSLLFSTSLRDNIALDQDYPDEVIWEAARIAQLEREILELPEKLATLVGERGITLSGGQRQRVAIARAIIKQPQILIMDDSFSAIDNETQSIILRELRKYRENRTTIIISHRISTVQHASQIVVLDNGFIIERGTHQQLLTMHGIYASMHHRQLLQAEINTSEEQYDAT